MQTTFLAALFGAYRLGADGRPAWLDSALYPFKDQYFNCDGHRLHYLDEGQGQPIVFVHGTPSWSFDFRHVIQAFAPTHRCIAPDHLGFGLSDKPADYAYRTQAHAANLEKLLDSLQLSEKIVLVVHDFGTPIGLEYALRNPNKIAKIVVMNGWWWSSEGEPEFERFKKILRSPLLPFLYKYLNFSPRFLLPSSWGDRRRLTRAVHRHYIRPFGKPSERLGALAFARSLLHDQAWFETRWQQRAALDSIPFLLIWGMKDSFVRPSHLEKFAQGFPQTRCVRLPDCGHFPQEEAPDAVVEAMRAFL